MAVEIEVLDKIMGSGKTTGIIDWMTKHSDERYMYVSPLLSEVENETGRLHVQVSSISFISPQTIDGETKTEHLLKLLQDGENICCTHSLYTIMTLEHLELIKSRDYIVIIDEEIDVMSPVQGFTSSDLKWLIKYNHVSVSNKDGQVSWIDGENIIDGHKYQKLKTLCDIESVYAAKRDESIMVTQLPVRLFSYAKRVIIITYMFEGNVLDCFLRLRECRIVPFTDVVLEVPSKDTIRNLITLVDSPSLMGNRKMSYSWYEDTATDQHLIEFEKLIKNVAKRCGAKAKDVMWTCPQSNYVKSRKNSRTISPRGYREFYSYVGDQRLVHPCWVSSGIKATNMYKERWCLIHLLNRYPNLSVEVYLQDYGYSIKRDVFALSELVQWVWRSRIRCGENIVLCIANKRMRELFNNWLLQSD